jgi:hypothetical protein
MMSETEYQRIKSKVEREYPVRQKLAKLAGRKLGDETLAELWVFAVVADNANPFEINAITRSVLQSSEDPK